MHKRLTRAFLHISWHTLATIAVIFALVLSVIWLTQSSIDELRPKVMEWVNTNEDYPLMVEKMSVQWKGIIPQLKFTGIKIYDKAEEQPLAQFDSALFDLSVYRSLSRKQITFDTMTINGIEISLIHNKDGSIRLVGSNETEPGQGDKFNKWLLQQPHLKIENARLNWFEKSDILSRENPLVLSEVTLSLINQDDHHKVKGSAKLVEQSATTGFGLVLNGDPQSSDWQASMSLRLEGLRVTHLLNATATQHLPVRIRNAFTTSDTHLSASIDSVWEKAKLTRASGRLELNNNTSGERISSNLEIQRTEDHSWDLELPEIVLTDADKKPSRFSGGLRLFERSKMDTPRLDAFIDTIDVETLASLMPIAIHQQLQPYKATGELSNIKLRVVENNISASGEFSSLNIAPPFAVDAVKNLAGRFSFTEKEFELVLDGKNVTIVHTPEPNSENDKYQLVKLNTLQRLGGTLKGEKKALGWQVHIPEFELVDQNLEFHLSGMVSGKHNDSPIAYLQGEFIRGDAAGAVQMLPDSLTTTPVQKWLEEAILDGRIDSGHFTLSGPLNKFPFDQGNGIFEVGLELSDAVLNYHKDWPRIEEIDAKLLISGSKLTITSHQARILNASLPETVVTIPDLATDLHHLIIQGKALGKINDGLTFIQDSPLDATVGQKLQYLTLKGDLDLDLQIDIPLYSTQEDAKVNGRIHLKENKVALNTLDLELTDINGDFIFDINSWSGEELSARLFGDPVNIKLDIEEDEASSAIELSGDADAGLIKKRLEMLNIDSRQLAFLDLIDGNSTWQAKLLLPSNPGDPDEDTDLVISSDLVGFSVNAPQPIGKEADEKLLLKISTSLTQAATKNIVFEYGNIVKTNLDLNNSASQSTRLERLVVHFGSDPVTFPKTKDTVIWIDGQITHLDLGTWASFLDQHFQVNSSIPIKPTENYATVNLSVDELAVAGQQFKNNYFQIDSGTDGWEVNLLNSHMEGILKIPYQLDQKVLTGKFKHLKLNTPGSNKTAAGMDPTSLPAMLIKADSLEVNDFSLGQLQLHTSRLENGSRIESIKLSSPVYQLYTSGEWLRNGLRSKNRVPSKSKFEVSIDAPALGPLLEKFGYNTEGFAGGEVTMNLESEWPGSPFDFNLAEANANLGIDIRDGRFTEIKNRAGKIFGLLSIQSLGRRLSLDFNDLFEKGFSYNSIQGHFDIENGDANTSSLVVAGTSAQIDLQGRVGLIAHDYDQLVTVKPSVADSLPMASALFGGPIGAGVGAAILLAGKVIPKLPDTIDKVLEKQYSLSGNWEEPVITPLAVETGKSSSPLEP